ncbi:hypothetical protein [Actinoplanes sp. NPDC051851]|uniref:hypothetical protein n=1 Tax=Actinoplanes sp. NPDC051851 TaxID=3154753 RepID=UPI00342E7863
MHHTNHWYGHAHVLAEYCGLDDTANPPRIDGVLQHGWNVGSGLGPRTRRAPGKTVYVWSEQVRRRAWSMGLRETIVVGSPFLYLLATQARDGVHPDDGPPREGTLWYPFHGWEKQSVEGDHERLIEEILATEPGPVTFCLYWHEYGNPVIRAAYERAGRVICNGYRGNLREQTEQKFLHNQLAELRRHRRVASNRLSSAVMYGTAAGCTPAVYGDPMYLAEEDVATAQRIRRRWPELHGADVDLAAARRTALDELGDGYLASPAELRTLLGWDDVAAIAPTARTEMTPAEMAPARVAVAA